MTSYLIIRKKSGMFAVVEKKSLISVAKAETWNKAVELMKQIKEQDKAKAEENKAKKEAEQKEYEKFLANLENGKICWHGKTKSGKPYFFYHNNGLEMRSRKCVTLYIDNKCVFTSGEIMTAVKYIMNN